MKKYFRGKGREGGVGWCLGEGWGGVCRLFRFIGSDNKEIED